jgi:hypothetical protein
MEPNNNGLNGLEIPTTSNPASSSDSSTGQTAENVSASATTIKNRKERSDKGKARGDRAGANAPSVPVLSQTQFAALYSPQLWEKALCAPADGMAAITGKKHWEVSKPEREAIGATGAIAAQCFAVTDPRWLALALCAITVLDVYGTRLAMDMADRRREAKEKKEAVKTV